MTKKEQAARKVVVEMVKLAQTPVETVAQFILANGISGRSFGDMHGLSGAAVQRLDAAHERASRLRVYAQSSPWTPPANFVRFIRQVVGKIGHPSGKAVVVDAIRRLHGEEAADWTEAQGFKLSAAIAVANKHHEYYPGESHQSSGEEEQPVFKFPRLLTVQ